MVEAVFTLTILLGLIWLAWNLCWALFAKSRMQQAVDIAARAAVTGQLAYGQTTLMNTIAQAAEHASPEFLTAHLGCQTLQINFFDQSGNSVSAPVDSGIVRVSVQSYPYILLAPIFSTTSRPQAVGSVGAQIWVSAARVSQACDPLNCPPVGTWPPGTCP
jgi:Flp pilus assembly protein TadG